MGYKGTTKWQGKFTLNQTFGDWVVIDECVVVDREAKLKCKCKCGVERYVSVLTLIRGISKRCSECGNSTEQHSGSKNGNWKGVGNVPGYYLNRRKLDKQTKQYAAKLIESQRYKCALTGLPISFVNKTASLDRINSTRPYTKKNIQWVHKDANVMKNGYNLEYFIKMCKLVATNYSTTNVAEAQSEFVFGNTIKCEIT